MEVFATLGVNLPDTMEATLVKFDHPAVAKLLEYRSHEKTLSAFGENVLGLINPSTGRIHPDFNQYGADTGRFSCTKPNIQQIPATSDFRKCFVAAPGYKLVTSDYSQAELRILAELSGDPAFVDAFRSGQDLHTLTASQMFGVGVDQVQKSQRSAAKAINFGLAYGMGPGGLAPRLGVALDEAKELISRYFKAYPGIQRWLDKAGRDAVRLGYSATPLGRKRYYNLPDESLKRLNEDEWRKQIAAIERQGKNSPIQGCNADMTKLALINLRAALKPWDARTVNTVHDEIVVEVREDQAEEVKHIVEREMVAAGEAILKEVPIVAEAAVADYWSK
jgi:DNA polymerase-1